MIDGWPAIPFIIPSIFLISGTALALTALVLRYKPTVDFPISFGVIIIGLFAPYAYLWNGGYPPRFSIHLLPLALLSLTFFLNYFVKGYKFSNHSKISRI